MHVAVPKEKKPGRRERWKQESWKVCVFRVGRMDVLNHPPAYLCSMKATHRWMVNYRKTCIFNNFMIIFGNVDLIFRFRVLSIGF